ncbi:MAG: hypothetical protein NZ742_06780 [Acidobacteria bacterium]|nr:hypothetical protein [Acidobacteriota bacterium]MDW7983271.1 hypothetical protein [Acidobacteriota bacterium]
MTKHRFGWTVWSFFFARLAKPHSPRRRRVGGKGLPVDLSSVEKVLLGVLITLGIGGCGPLAAYRQVLDVPFYAQRQDRDCGITSLRILLTFYGWASARTALETVEAPQGLMPLEIERFLRDHGVAYRVLPGTPEALTEAVRSGQPVLLLLNLSRGPYRRFHYVVAVGVEIGDNGRVQAFFIHDGRTPARRVSAAWLTDRWNRAHGWAIVLELRQVGRWMGEKIGKIIRG